MDRRHVLVLSAIFLLTGLFLALTLNNAQARQPYRVARACWQWNCVYWRDPASPVAPTGLCNAPIGSKSGTSCRCKISKYPPTYKDGIVQVDYCGR
jgi:hypothetical protein